MGMIQAQSSIDTDVADAWGIGRPREGTQVRSADQTMAEEHDERIPGNGFGDGIFTEPETGFLVGQARPGDDVPDLGCGTGRFTITLPKRANSVRAGISPFRHLGCHPLAEMAEPGAERR